MEAFDAIVLAGGEGRRLGGTDKASLVVGEESLLSRALRSIASAERIVVVGPERDLTSALDGSSIVWTTEDPAGGGPAAAVAAGMHQARNQLIVVLACDMPFVDAAAVERLIAEIGSSDAAMLVDSTGRRQYLAAAYRRSALVDALDALPRVDGASMRSLTTPLTVTEVLADPDTTLDCDTWDDVERSRQLLEER